MVRMDDTTVKKSPAEAHREGLEEIGQAPHHPTTERDKPRHPAAFVPEITPGEKHRDGMLPNVKK